VLQIPQELIDQFRDKKVMLFVGSGCSKDAGFPSWKELIDEMKRLFDDQGYDTAGQISGYIKRSDFKRAAKGLHDLDADLYRRLILRQIDPPNYRGHIPSWYRYIDLLCAPVVATTNWDNVIEDATSYRRMHWLTDPRSLLEQRQSNRRSVFHVHGHIQNFDTIVHNKDDYDRFNGAEGDEARRYLGRLAEGYSFLFVGYSLADPFITDIVNDMSRNWKAQPDFFKLEPNPTDESRRIAREEHGLTLVPYDKEVNRAGFAGGWLV